MNGGRVTGCNVYLDGGLLTIGRSKTPFSDSFPDSVYDLQPDSLVVFSKPARFEVYVLEEIL